MRGYRSSSFRHGLCRLVGAALLLACTTSTAAPPAPGGAFPVDVRIAPWRDRVRLVVESTKRFPWQRFTSSYATTLEISLDGIDASRLQTALTDEISRSASIVRSYQLISDGDSLRLHLTLHDPARASLFTLHPMDGHSHRVVLDIFPLPAGTPPPTSITPSSTPRELWLVAQLNHQSDVRTVLALEHDKRLWISRVDLQRWNIIVPETGTLAWAGEDYVDLTSSDIDFTIDRQQMTLTLDAPAQRLQRNRLAPGSSEYGETTAPHPGGFFNYDVSVSRDEQTGLQRRNGFFELGMFNQWGSGTHSILARDDGTREDVVRLETTWRKDNPEAMSSLILGDTINGGTDWSGAVRFGGLHWGTNFSTRPEYITMPLVSISGETELPSTVDLYVNDALRLREEIPSGPFSIDSIPTVTGSGEARVVVRDIFGREQVITQPFYGSSTLLRAGLQEWSLDAGAVRQDYSMRSDHYGPGMAAATWRRGIRDDVTVESHAQGTRDLRMAGAGLHWLPPVGVTLSVAGAASNAPAGTGSLGKIGVRHQGRHVGFGGEAQHTSPAFRRLGVSDDTLLPHTQYRLFAGASSASLGSGSIGYTRQTYHDGEELAFATLSYNRRLGYNVHLGLSAIHFLDSHDTGVQAMLTVPLGPARTTASVGANHQDNHDGEDVTYGEAQIQRSLPSGTGFGYRLRSRFGDEDLSEGSLSYQNQVGTWSAEGARYQDNTAWRVNGRGGVAYLGGHLLASRYIDQSFALVNAGSIEGVRVYSENQEVTRTNHSGVALVPRLRAYERNRIALEQADLPLDTRIGELETTVSPWYRSGVIIDFDVRTTQSALARLRHGDRPVPAGAVVTDPQGNRFPVANDGLVYLSGDSIEGSYRAEWSNGTCVFAITNIRGHAEHGYSDQGEVSCTRP